ncbi:MAG TPA: hypothetical protein VK576_04500, partial [Thermoleophilia bacterium]|nr:hypothetical protein [Thermoleophilia bacterium]
TLEDFRVTGYVEYGTATLETLAQVCLQSGDAVEATLLMGGVDNVRLTLGIPRQPRHRAAWDACVDAARRVLGDADFRSAWAEGVSWDFGSVVDHCLGNQPLSRQRPQGTPAK